MAEVPIGPKTIPAVLPEDRLSDAALPGSPPIPAGQIVILNGPPRSGKSSIAAAIQSTFDAPWINLGVDHSMATTPARLRPGIGLRPGGERPDLEPHVATLYTALYESIAAHSRLGLNVVVDVGHHDDYSRPLGILANAARRLADLPALFVGIRCPVDVLTKRRAATGMVTDVAMVERWNRAVHDPGIYDLEIDTSTQTVEQAAATIHRRLQEGPLPTALPSHLAEPER